MRTKLKYLSLILLASLTQTFLSCDDGKIYEEEYLPDTSGRVMKLNANISGMNSWARGYSLVLAGFDNSLDYAIITKPVPFPGKEGGDVELVMSGIPPEVTTVHLCVVNRQRELIHSYVTMECNKNEQDTIRMEGINQDVNMYDAIQEEVFSDDEYGCVRCHGARESLAGGINLLKGKSYASLTSKRSGIAGTDMLIVNPGDAETSTLYLMLGTDFGAGLKYNHANILINSYANTSLVKDWINNGAKEK